MPANRRSTVPRPETDRPRPLGAALLLALLMTIPAGAILAIEIEVVRDGVHENIEIKKVPDEGLGIDFQDAAFDGVRTCNNACFFCFLKGNPKGMRKTLYVKDDDYRLSFFHGNFVTLTYHNPASRRVAQAAQVVQSFPLDPNDPQITIGREGSDIVLDNPQVSRNHASIDQVNGKHVLRDVGSTNGLLAEA